MKEQEQKEIINRIGVNKKKFLDYNQFKLNYLYSSISADQIIDLFEAIPFLIGINHQGLPGYIAGENALTGIKNFQAGQRGLKFMKTHFPAVPLSMNKSINPFIQMFALMGSGGTIAFNDHSDFDFWICANEEEIDRQAIQSFKNKCRVLEEWIADNFNIEVHFFLNDINNVKKNIFDDDAEEIMAGATLGELLKEEFLRSSIILQGKIPFWWMVSGDSSDEKYDAWLAAANKSHHHEEFVDLGNLYAINREEFLIAALFQLLKSLGNPFKSIIKLGLLERYLNDSSTNPFISYTVKKNVLEGKLNFEDVDSYIIMFDQVYDYYRKVTEDETAFEVLQTCFYLKVDPQVSNHLEERNKEGESYKIKKMSDYVKQWEWTETYIREMDDFEDLDIDSINKFWYDIKRFILKRYKEIIINLEKYDKLANLHTQEFKGISRKISSHFSVSANKIDNTLSFKAFPQEKLLSIEFIRDKSGKEFWILSKRIIVKNYPTKVIIHKNSSLIGIIVWVALNKLFQKDYTRLEIASGILAVDTNFIRELIADLSIHFLVKKLTLHNHYFLMDSFPVISYIIINPYTKYSKQIDDIIFLYHNSWGETKFEQYKHIDDIMQIFTRVLNGAHVTGKDFDYTLRLSASDPFDKSREFDRLYDFMKDCFTFFENRKPGGKSRYISFWGNRYYVFSNKKTKSGEIIALDSFDMDTKMLLGLSYNTGLKNILKADKRISELNYLRLIIENYKENVIQIYCMKTIKYGYFFVSDERGSLTFYRKLLEEIPEYLSKLYLFTVNLIKSVTSTFKESPLSGQLKQVEIYNLNRDVRNHCTLEEINPELDKTITEFKRRAITLMIAPCIMKNNEIGYCYRLHNSDFSEIITKESIVQKEAPLIKSNLKRFQGNRPIVTGIDLSRINVKQFKIFTSFGFSQKNLFELLLERSN